jgi:hypothetical protein
MAKKTRQAHIPKQAVTRRKPRRPATPAVAREPAPVFADEPALNIAPAMGVQAPVDTRPRTRLEALRQSRETVTPMRVVPGQLPTFERAYLVSELRRIGVISTALLGLIIVLTILLR